MRICAAPIPEYAATALCCFCVDTLPFDMPNLTGSLTTHSHINGCDIFIIALWIMVTKNKH